MRLIDTDALTTELNAAKEEFETGENADKSVIVNGAMIVSAVNEFFIKTIADAPTVDAAPVVHGKWITRCVFDENPFECSECGNSTNVVGYKICPYCGAKMDKEDEEE